MAMNGELAPGARKAGAERRVTLRRVQATWRSYHGRAINAVPPHDGHIER